MKFVKGIILGTVVSAGVAIASMNRNKILRKGRKIAKKMHII